MRFLFSTTYIFSSRFIYNLKRFFSFTAGFLLISLIFELHYLHMNSKNKELNRVLGRIADKWNSRSKWTVTVHNTCGYMTSKWPFGRLGVKMSALAALYSIAKRNNKMPYILPETKIDSVRKIYDLNFLSGNIPEVFQNESQAYDASKVLKSTCALCYVENATKTQCGKNTFMTGYFSHPNYYHKTYTKDLFRLFTLNKPLLVDCLVSIREHLQAIFTERNVTNCVLIGVHARRGDKVVQALEKDSYSTGKVYGKRAASADFIRRAMQIYEQRFFNQCLIFLILGDDYDWNTQIVGNDTWNVLALTPTRGKPYTDMCILASCDHAIMTYGTFSFWSAYLTAGDVIYQENSPDKLDEWTGLKPCLNNVTVEQLSLMPECWPRADLPYHTKRSCEYRMLHNIDVPGEDCYAPQHLVDWTLEYASKNNLTNQTQSSP